APAALVLSAVTAPRLPPGGHPVLTAGELGGVNQPSPLLIPHPTLTAPRTQRPLAVDEVRFVGEAVAFVVADDRYLAEDAVGLIEVESEPLPAIVDLVTALIPGGPRVHADVPDNRAARFRQTVGDADAAMARAHRVLRERLTIERSCGSPMETRGVAAEWDPRRRGLRGGGSTQAPLPVQNGGGPLLALAQLDHGGLAPRVGAGVGAEIMLFSPPERPLPCD